MLAASPGTEYLGPLYAEAKDRFYERLNFFLFPSKLCQRGRAARHTRSAEKRRIRLGCDRGAIAEILGNGAGFVSSKEAS